MAQQVVLSEDGEVIRPILHDAKIRGFVLCSGERLLVPLELADAARLCLILHGVERFCANDFREGNILLDVTVASSSNIDQADVAYAYGIGLSNSTFLQSTTERLVKDGSLVVKFNPSYGCAAVCICRRIEIEDDTLSQW